MAAYTKDSPGPPVGEYFYGDTCTDSDGQEWTCVVPGNPAEWHTEVAGEGGGGVNVPEDIANISEDTELTVEQTNTTFYLDQADGLTILLPGAGQGVNFTFIVQSPASGADYSIDAPGGNIIYGNLSSSDGDPANTATSPVGSVAFKDTNMRIGDWVHLISDGVYWYVRGNSALAAGISLT